MIEGGVVAQIDPKEWKGDEAPKVGSVGRKRNQTAMDVPRRVKLQHE